MKNCSFGDFSTEILCNCFFRAFVDVFDRFSFSDIIIA